MSVDRIAQFEKMAAADPDNEMAHFSLGAAYLQAGRFGEAARALENCLERAPGMSKAWQLAGEAMIRAGWEDKAVKTLTRGYEVAAERGDQMPRQAIASLLRSIGREPPVTREVAAVTAPGTGTFRCRRTGQIGTPLGAPPFRGPIGAWIGQNISSETWRAWIGQGTKVINELRLDFSREGDQETYDQHMREYLGIDEDVLAEIRATGALA